MIPPRALLLSSTSHGDGRSMARALLDALSERGETTRSALQWGGVLPTRAGLDALALVIEAWRIEEVAAWLKTLSPYHAEAALWLSVEELKRPQGLGREAARALPGLGLWPVSCGVDRSPWVSQSPARIAAQLEAIEHQIAPALPLTVVAPPPGPLFIAVDDMVARALKQRGVSAALVPELQPPRRRRDGVALCRLRRVERGDDPDELLAWCRGEPGARARRLAQRLRRAGGEAWRR